MEQIDLYLVSLNIGTLWYGIGKREENDFCHNADGKKTGQGRFQKRYVQGKKKRNSTDS